MVELCGAVCSAFVGTSGPDPLNVSILYIRLDDTWHRFFLDVGLLLWRSGDEPNPEDDLSPGETYRDLAAELAVLGVALADIVMTADGVLRITFRNGASLVLSCRSMDDGGTIEELARGWSALN